MKPANPIQVWMIPVAFVVSFLIPLVIVFLAGIFQKSRGLTWLDGVSGNTLLRTALFIFCCLTLWILSSGR